MVSFIVNRILLDRLELEDDGYSEEDFNEDTLIMGDGGLDLDSVDMLDLIVGIEKEYGFRAMSIDSNYISEKCRSISTLVDMVIERSTKAAEA